MATNAAELLLALKALTAAPARTVPLAGGQYGALNLTGLIFDPMIKRWF